MSRIFNDYAYQNGPRDGCWWDQTCDIKKFPKLAKNISVDVAIIGAGFTGMSAAFQLASHGLKVAVLESHFVGWGASGRNGGFCCLGGGIADDPTLDRLYGREARLEFRRAEKAAVAHVSAVIEDNDLDVDRHSNGETVLAHRPKDMEALRNRKDSIFESYGVNAALIEKRDLETNGMGGGPFYGALTVPLGFALNPQKYLAGITRAAEAAGATIYDQSPVNAIEQIRGSHLLNCPGGTVKADEVVIATNGYSSEHIPKWLAGRYMPSQSTVLVTHPLTDREILEQGWTTDQMSYDSRNLLHYFRLMPDRRFLFGMRGGLFTGARFEAAARARTRADFEKMFPRWADVATSHSWSGMVSLARDKLPFVGKIPQAKGQWAAMCYHGNGVAMGSFAGKLVADELMGRDNRDCPSIMRRPLGKFPFGRARRVIMPPLYFGLELADRF